MHKLKIEFRKKLWKKLVWGWIGNKRKVRLEWREVGAGLESPLVVKLRPPLNETKKFEWCKIDAWHWGREFSICRLGLGLLNKVNMWCVMGRGLRREDDEGKERLTPATDLLMQHSPRPWHLPIIEASRNATPFVFTAITLKMDACLVGVWNLQFG